MRKNAFGILNPHTHHACTEGIRGRERNATSSSSSPYYPQQFKMLEAFFHIFVENGKDRFLQTTGPQPARINMARASVPQGPKPA
eukprot:3406188-Pyramimonas_sp.AAC.1